jgi:arylsulfatase A-like enzyme
MISVLSLGILLGFGKGFLESAHYIMINQYLQYGTFRLIMLNFQNHLNVNIQLFVGGLLALYFISLVFVIQMKINKKKVLIFLLVAMAIWASLLSIDILLRIFTNFTFKSAFNRFYMKFNELLVEQISLWYFIKLLINPIVAVLILVSILIVIPLLYWSLKRVNVNIVLKILDSKYIKKTAFLFFSMTMLFNLFNSIDRRVNSPDGPNVILLVVDTLRADHISCYGYEKTTSPNIDRLSMDSILFKNAISVAPWTTPSIAAIITSQYPAIIGIKNDPVVIDPRFLTLAEIFRNNNYKTKGIISHTFLSSTLGFHQGFDSYDESNSKGYGYISSPSITEEAISYILKNKNSKFFLFLHYFDPHFDYIKHESFDYYSDYKGRLYSGQPIDELYKEASRMTEDDVRYLNALYDSEISFTDKYVGELLDKLKELGLYDNTLIVFTADHGEEFLERGENWIGHTKTLFQELIHVPLILKLPGNAAREVVNEYVGLVDLMPTIVANAGINIPDRYEYEGEVFKLKRKMELNGKAIFSETKRESKLLSMIRNGWKLIYNQKDESFKLFNLNEDKEESLDVISENERIYSEMKRYLLEWNNYVKSRNAHFRARRPEFTETQKEYLRSLGYIQ